MMVFEWRDLVWLLLPLAVISGWAAGRGDQRRRQEHSRHGLSSGYFRGINFVINEQPDKAIEVFTRMIEVNTETVETHLALGSLFRRRGEVERAIRIHQNLIARPTLDREQRAQALCELALDYQKAGLLDRAENLFLELAEIPAHTELALRMLMAIYEQEREWAKAAVSARRLAQFSGRDLRTVLAQHACEQAEQAIQAGERGQAMQFLAEALKSDPKCVRANILLGRLDAQESAWRPALKHWQAIEDQAPLLLDEVIDDIVSAYRHLEDVRGLQAYLRATVQHQPGPRTLQRYVELLYQQEGGAAAENFVIHRLRRTPSVSGLRCLIDVQRAMDSGADRERLELLKRVLDQLVEEQARYLCRQCGFRAQKLHWQCPACHGWVTMQQMWIPEGDSVTPTGNDRAGKNSRAGRISKP
jgi:lipopolysaccharide biosynthesis regulator YciM